MVSGSGLLLQAWLVPVSTPLWEIVFGAGLGALWLLILDWSKGLSPGSESQLMEVNVYPVEIVLPTAKWGLTYDGMLKEGRTL